MCSHPPDQAAAGFCHPSSTLDHGRSRCAGIVAPELNGSTPDDDHQAGEDASLLPDRADRTTEASSSDKPLRLAITETSKCASPRAACVPPQEFPCILALHCLVLGVCTAGGNVFTEHGTFAAARMVRLAAPLSAFMALRALSGAMLQARHNHNSCALPLPEPHVTDPMHDTRGIALQISAGHLSRAELSAVVLGSSFCNVFGMSPCAGLASTLDTLCGQVRQADNCYRSRIF